MTVRVTITLVDVESGESIILSGLGSGQDSGDKAVMKAQTAAIKYAYLMSLAISTNDDPEADVKTDEGSGEKKADRAVSSGSNAFCCSNCSASITAGVNKVSLSKYGRALCMTCQKMSQTVEKSA